jgi:hypothetical protein
MFYALCNGRSFLSPVILLPGIWCHREGTVVIAVEGSQLQSEQELSKHKKYMEPLLRMCWQHPKLISGVCMINFSGSWFSLRDS